MILQKVISASQRCIEAMVKPAGLVASFFIALMALVVAANVAGRFFFHKPVLGTIELVELMMVIIGSLAIPYTALMRRHIRIDIIVSRFSGRMQKMMMGIVYFLGAGIYGVIAYQGFLKAMDNAQNMYLTTATLNIPIAPFNFFLFLGFALFCLVFLVCILRPLPAAEDKDKEGTL